jgi:DNA-binding transcriptional LysR family regulator
MDPSWELYRSFLAVFREGSLSGAARALSLTQPTIGRHLDALEEALSVALFTRSQSGLRPTTAATSLVPHVEAMAGAAAALRRVASGEAEEERGAVRVTASEVVGIEVLPPILAAFREAHPRIDVELVLSNRTADLLKREADLAVRMVKPTQQALVTKKIGVVRAHLHAHPRYLQTHGTPRTLEALSEHAIVGYDTGPSVQRLLPGVPISRSVFAFRSDSDVAQLAAIRAGFGIGFCQAPIGRRESLTPLFRRELGFDMDIWLAMHRDLKSSRRVRLLFDHLARHLRAYLAIS